MVIEKWSFVLGYENMYSVSNTGMVRSEKRLVNHPVSGNMIIQSRILKYKLDKDGYCEVSLSKEGKTKSFKIHVLVAKAFIENPNYFTEINHMDLDKSNNSVTNLEWCTRAKNVQHARDNGRIKLSKINLATASEIRIDKSEGLSNKNLQLKYGLKKSQINNIIAHRSW